MARRYQNCLIYFPTLFIFTILIIRIPLAPIGDFANYFYGSKFLIEGKFNLSIYDVANFNEAVQREGLQNFFLSYTSVPPITSVFFIPLTWLTVYQAKMLWSVINGFIFILIQFRLLRNFEVHKWVICFLPILFFLSLKSNLYQGQMYILISYFYLEGLLFYEKNKKFPAAVLWSITILLKLFPIILLGFLLFRKDFKTILQIILFILAIYFIVKCAATPVITELFVLPSF